LPSIKFYNFDGLDPFSRTPEDLKNRKRDNDDYRNDLTIKERAIQRRKIAYAAIEKKLLMLHGYEKEIQKSQRQLQINTKKEK